MARMLASLLVSTVSSLTCAASCSSLARIDFVTSAIRFTAICARPSGALAAAVASFSALNFTLSIYCPKAHLTAWPAACGRSGGRVDGFPSAAAAAWDSLVMLAWMLSMLLFTCSVVLACWTAARFVAYSCVAASTPIRLPSGSV